VLNGVIPPSTQFTAMGKTMGGNLVQVQGVWTYDRIDLAAIDPLGGVLTATGLLGGTGNVTFESMGVKGTTTATVKIHVTSDPQSVDPTIKALFPNATTPDPSMSLLYPYDKTVFPKGL